MPGISEVYEQSLLTANTVWRKLTRPVFRPGRTPNLRGPLVRKIPTAAGSGVLQSEWNHRLDEESSIDEPRGGIGVLGGSELSLGGAPLGAPPRPPGLPHFRRRIESVLSDRESVCLKK
jgi:hypothetical protein